MATDSLARALALQAGTAHPGYIAGNWYCPPGYTTAVGSAIPVDSIRLLPFTITKPITVAQLAARVSTISAAGNFQLAVYAHNPATGRPTGAALCSTANMSTGSAAAVSAAVTPVTLSPGTYWMALNQDNSVAIYQTMNNATGLASAIVGSATLGNVTSTTSNVAFSLSVAQAFGTWPNLTAGSFVEAIGNINALVFMKAA